MKPIRHCLLLLGSMAAMAALTSPALAAPTLDAPATALAGSKIPVKVSGSTNPRDFVSVVLKGAPAGRYGEYTYVSKPGEISVGVPNEPGDYEVRLLGADSPYATLASRPIKLMAPTASLKAPAQVGAGAKFSVEWTGPANERDYVGIGETTPQGRPYLSYVYTSNGSPITLAAPEKSGTYEVRYFLASGDKIIARQTITVGAVSASVSAPASVAAGESVSVQWTGPNNPKDFIAIVKAGAPEKSWLRYEYTRAGNPLKIPVPDVAGDYELRYCTGTEYVTLARAKLAVGPITGTITSPATIVAGETLKVGWKGPINPRNFISIVAKGSKDGASGPYAYTRTENPVSIVAPLAAGDYEVRYSTGQSYQTLARAALAVTPAKNEPGFVKVTTSKPAFAGGAVEIILDASGSMLQKLGNQRRIDIAKQTLTKLTSTTIPKGTPFALRVFGREVDSCQTDLDVAVGPLDPAAVGARIGALVAKNGAKTPIGSSLEKTADDLKSVAGEKLIVVITDGEETCGGDPAAAIAALRKAGVAPRVSIVGFALDDAALAATFRRWADAGGGAFFDAKDAAGLDKSLTEAMRAGFEVVNAQGQVLATGIVGGDAVHVPSGNVSVRLKGRANTAKTVTVGPKATVDVVL